MMMVLRMNLLVLTVSVLLVASANSEQDPRPLHVVICLGPGKGPLSKLASYLKAKYHVQVNWVEAEKAKEEKATVFKGLEHLADADVILSNLYRTSAPPNQLAVLKKFFLSKPVVGMRKAHHGFQNWLDVDQEVFGVKYRGHYFGKNVSLSIVDKHKDHPFFAGVKTFLPGGGLYSHGQLADDVEVYMTGGPEGKEPMAQTWSRIVKDRGQRVFYTRYDPEDLKDEGIRDMVVRVLFWAGNRDEKEHRKK